MPHLRSSTSPSSRWPLAATRAFLHSLIPAPVRSRRCFTSAAVISAINLCFLPYDLDGDRPPTPRKIARKRARQTKTSAPPSENTPVSEFFTASQGAVSYLLN